jgi:hypothetical protein
MKTVPLNIAIKDFRRYFTKKAPSILTGLGIGFGFASTILAVGATPKALTLIKEKKEETGEEKLSVIDTVKTAGTCYIPSAITAICGVCCIVSANKKHIKRNAVLATAYSVAEHDLREYRCKVVETLGEKKEKDIRGKIVKDHTNENPPTAENILTPNGGKTLCYDNWSGRYFMSDMETLRRCENDLNARILKDQFVPLNDLYDMLHLDNVKLGEDFGWNYDGLHDELIRFDYFSQLDANGNPCLVLDFDAEPYDIYQGGR